MDEVYYTGWHMHIKLFHDSIIFHLNTGYFIPKNGECPHFQCVTNCFSDMPWPISFKLDMNVVHVGLLMHVIFFVIRFKMALCIFSHFLDMLGLSWFKVDTWTRYTSWHMHV